MIASAHAEALSLREGVKASFRNGRSGPLQVEIFGAIDDARADWAELATAADPSPYQSLAFVEAWFATIGAATGRTPFVVVARDASGRAEALLPFAVRRIGPLIVASFPGGKHSNYNLGLFRPGRAWDSPTLRALLVAAGRARRPGIDGFALLNQPLAWGEAANPLAGLGGVRSPSAAARSELPDAIEAWRAAHLSKAARKKHVQTGKRLRTMGVVAHRIARDAGEASLILDAALAQKQARAAAGGPPNAYATAASQAFLRRLAEGGAKAGAPLELHALTLDGRPIATFGGLASRGGPGQGRLSGLLLGRDSDAEVARCGPGRLLLHEVVASAIARGLTAFDLGIGDARYKRDFCEVTEALIDAFIPVTPLGRAAGLAFRVARQAKGRIKRSPRLVALSRFCPRNG